MHKDTGKVVALKVLRSVISDDSGQTDQFYREGLMGVSLRHPNIVPILRIGLKGELALPGHGVCRRGKSARLHESPQEVFSPAEATKFAIDIAAGLDYAFQRGISHRDLKLTNVLASPAAGRQSWSTSGLPAPTRSWLTNRLTGERIKRANHRLRRPGTRHRRAQGRCPQRHLFHRLHLLSHADGTCPRCRRRSDRIQRLSKSRFTGVVPIHQACPGIPRVVAAVVNKAMSLEPEKRYQTPGQMHADLRMAADRLAAGEDEAYVGTDEVTPNESAPLSPADQIRKQREAARYLPDSQRRALLVVESNSQLQDAFRDALKRYGYRVLMISDPKRAMVRLEDPAHPVDGIILSSGELGEGAIDAFIDMASGEQTGKVPAVLLLDMKHPEWQAKLKPHLAGHRVALSLPVKLREVRDLLFRLVPPVATAET